MKFSYYLTEAYRSDQFVKTGVRPDLYQQIVLDPIAATERIRFLFEELTRSDSVWLPEQGRILSESDLPEILELLWNEEQENRDKEIDRVRKLAEDLLNNQQSLGQVSYGQNARRVRDLMRKCGLDTLAIDDVIEQHDIKAAENQAKKEREEELERERQKEEKSQWIEQHGSKHLKRAHSKGFNCHRQYLSERAESEIPGSVLDWDDNASWGSCACPSMDALDALDAAPNGAELVWLKESPEAPTEDDYYNHVEFEPCEAIVIRRYLGSRYDLVKII